ncbi:MAG: hypothetical protein LQ340_006328 [Diploschistes diacapsis]|nr:MAG: hypothetical protein LQ340_006328 [Diploschistes diacapsis]
MFGKMLAVAACAFAALAQAQNALQFTQTPANAQVGQSSTISWTGGNGGHVTLTLRQGPDPNNLATIAIITGDASGNSYTWTPSSSIPPATDYALEISQGEDTTNYSGFFSVLGGQAAVSTTIVAVGGSTTIPITTIAPSTTAAANVTTATTKVSVTAILTGTASSAGTGTALHHNTTFYSQTLTAASTATGLSAGSVTATGSGAGSSTPASSSSASVPSTAGGAVLKAQLGAGLGVFAAAVFML